MARLRTVPPRISAVSTRIKSVTPGSWRGTETSSTKRGYGYRWQKYRASFLEAHPLCVMCEAQGRVVAASVVDHITPHRGDHRLFWDPKNHQPLCKPCHDGAKQRLERGASRA